MDLGEFSNRYVKNYKDDKDYVDVNVDICVNLKKKTGLLKLKNTNIIILIAGEQTNPFCIIRWMPGLLKLLQQRSEWLI